MRNFKMSLPTILVRGELVADMAVDPKEVRVAPRDAPESIEGDDKEEPCTEDMEMSCCVESCVVKADPPAAEPSAGLESIVLSKLMSGRLPIASAVASLLRRWPWRGVARSDCPCSVNIDDEGRGAESIALVTDGGGGEGAGMFSELGLEVMGSDMAMLVSGGLELGLVRVHATVA